MFEPLQYRENTPPYQFKGKLEAAFPVVSPDKLSNTFDIREDALFSDGRSVTPADILFSFRVIRYASGINYIAWNNAQPIFRDKRVRRSMAHLTPRKSIIRDLIHGLGANIDGPIHMSLPEFHAGLESLEHHRDRAAELLQAAGSFDTYGDRVLDRAVDGVKTVFRFEFLVPVGSQLYKDIGVVVQDELADMGVDC